MKKQKIKMVTVYCEYTGHDQKLDKAILECLNQFGENIGSGFDMTEKVRDFEYKIPANKFEEVQFRLSKYPSVRVELLDEDLNS